MRGRGEVGQGVSWERLGSRGGSMRARCVARAGRWAAHRLSLEALGTESLYFQRRRNQAAPPPCRHGESNPEPCRPSGRQGGPANGFFRIEKEESVRCAGRIRSDLALRGRGRASKLTWVRLGVGKHSATVPPSSARAPCRGPPAWRRCCNLVDLHPLSCSNALADP